MRCTGLALEEAHAKELEALRAEHSAAMEGAEAKAAEAAAAANAAAEAAAVIRQSLPTVSFVLSRSSRPFLSSRRGAFLELANDALVLTICCASRHYHKR